MINGVFNPLTQFDGTLVHAKGIGLFNGVNFVGEVVPPEANVVALRRVNPLFGLGLVDAVPDQTLEDLARLEQDLTPATAGRANVVTDVASGQPRVGRFGWKCQIGTVLTFAANAYQNEIGVTTPFFPNENCPQGDCALLAANPAQSNPNDTNETPMMFADFVTFLRPRLSGTRRRTPGSGRPSSWGSAAPLAMSRASGPARTPSRRWMGSSSSPSPTSCCTIWAP